MNSLIYGDTGGFEIYTLSLTSQFMPVRYAVSASVPPKIPSFDANIFDILL